MSAGKRSLDRDEPNLRIGDLVAYQDRLYVLRGVDPRGVDEPRAYLDDGSGTEISVPLAAIRTRLPPGRGV
jgi:hypothetical protein